MPSTSGRTMSYPRRADKLRFFLELKEIRDRLASENTHLEQQEKLPRDIKREPSIT